MEEEARNFDEEFERTYKDVCTNCENKLKEDRNKLNKFLITVFFIAVIINIIIVLIQVIE